MKSVGFEEDIMIKRLFDKLFSSNLKINKKETPSRKLCDDIQHDYWGLDQNNRYTLLSKKGFLEDEFCINEQKYSVVSSEQNNCSFKIAVEDIYSKKIFEMQILYGNKSNSSDQHIIYIERFCRLSDHSCGIGRQMAIYIRKLAESRGFQVIGVHPVAEIVGNKGYMNQENLEKFYKQYLNGKSVKLEFMNNSNNISYVDFNENIIKSCGG